MLADYIINNNNNNNNNPRRWGAYFTHLPVGRGPGVFGNNVNHSKSVISHFTVKQMGEKN